MPVSFKFRAGVLSIAVLIAVVFALILVSRTGPVSKRETHVAKAAEPVVPATRSPMTAADWREKIARTPASGWAGIMRELLALADEGLRNELATALVVEWMSRDLDGYLAFLDAQLVEEGLFSESMKRFSVVMMRGFETTSGKTELQGKMRYVAEAITSYMTANNLDGAESWAREFLVGLDMDIALAKIAPAMVAKSPEKAQAIFAGIKSVMPRLTGASALGTALASHDPATALRWADSLGGHSERTLAMGSVATTIAETNPTLAASSLKTFLQKIQDEYIGLREKDREQSGVKAADEFQTPELYQEYLDTNGYALMQPDTPEADYLLKAAEQIANHLGKSDPRGALAWAESLAVGIVRAHSISGALSGWSLTAPREAVDYYLANHSYDPVIPLYLFENWAVKDPASAVTAINDLLDAGQKSSAIEGVTNGWLKSGNDLAGLSEWIGQLPAGRDRDTATVEIVTRTGDQDPVAAWQLVIQISAPDVRRRAAGEIFTVLAVDQPEVARSVLDQYQASSEEIENLERILSIAQSPN